MKKVMILGTGNAQIDAIEYCKARNYKVYGCSYIDTECGVSLCDEFRKINITDIESVSAYAREKQVDLIYSVGSDIAMPTVNRVSEELGLPHFISSQTAEICNKKHEMRLCLSKLEEGSVNFNILENIEVLDKIDIQFHKMLKPADSLGQRGVVIVNSKEEIVKFFNRSMEYSRCRKVILEDFLDGSEISINTYLLNGKVIFFLVSDRISFSEYPGGIIKEHVLPTHFSDEVVQRCKVLVKNALNILNILNGPVYFQMKVVNNVPYIIEITPRLDGCHMWRLIKYYCNVDLLDMSFYHLLNGAPICGSSNKQKEKYILKFMCQEPGSRFKKVTDENAIFSKCYYKAEEEIKHINGYMEKCGYIIKSVSEQ